MPRKKALSIDEFNRAREFIPTLSQDALAKIFALAGASVSHHPSREEVENVFGPALNESLRKHVLDRLSIRGAASISTAALLAGAKRTVRQSTEPERGVQQEKVARIQAILSKKKEKQKQMPRQGRPRDEPMYDLIDSILDIYLRAFGVTAAPSVGRDGAPAGPAVRVVEGVLCAYALLIPDSLERLHPGLRKKLLARPDAIRDRIRNSTVFGLTPPEGGLEEEQTQWNTVAAPHKKFV